MADPADIKKVNNMLEYMTIVEEIESISTADNSIRREDAVTPIEDEENEPSRGPYRWVMRIFESPRFPSLCADSIDVHPDSVCAVADECWKSHIYNIRCAIEGMSSPQKFIVWLDYDFFRLKNDPNTKKVAVDKLEPGEGKQLKTGALETYTGLTSREFKTRLYEHHSDFNNQTREGTSLSNFIWKLKSDRIPYTINWKILMRSQSFNPSNKTCSLCLKEKYCIMFRPEGATLNARSEFFSTCRHRLKPLLKNT